MTDPVPDIIDEANLKAVLNTLDSTSVAQQVLNDWHEHKVATIHPRIYQELIESAYFQTTEPQIPTWVYARVRRR